MLGLITLRAELDWQRRMVEISLSGVSGGGRKRDHGSRTAAQCESDWISHRTLPCARRPSTQGLPDDLYRPYVRARRGQPEQLSNLLVRLNTGSGFGPVEDWGTMQGQGIRDSARGTSHDLIDINGDGLLDDVYRPRQTGSRGYKPLDHYLVRLNTGSGFGPVQSWGDGLGGTLHDSYRGTVSHTLMDINGDGLVDDVQRVPGTKLVSSARRNVKYPKDYEVRLNQSGPPALLTMVQLPTGGRIEYEYGVSTQFDNTDYTGTPRLANKIRVVTAITRDDAMGSTSTSRISYRGGLYEGYPKCEFRGFREVEIVDATGAKTVSTYLQDDACWGHSNGSQRFSADNALLSATQSEWTYREIQAVTDDHGGIVFPYVETARTKTFDGAESPRTREQHYIYDDYGNVTQVTDRGDVAVDGDEIRTRTDYAINDGLWLVNRPSREIIEDKHPGAWTPARITYTHYDNSIHGTVSTGNVTRIDAWLNDNEYATTTFGHDAYGNTVWTRDANANGQADWPVNEAGHTNDVVFDTVFHTVAIEQRNALDHVTLTEFDPLLRPVAITDANGQQTITSYDAHGRPTAITKPGDSAPTVTIEYVHDGVAPEYSIRRSHTEDGKWLAQYALVDGLGRTIQTKVPDGDGFVASDQYYDALGRKSAVSQSYRSASLVSNDPSERLTEELPLLLLGDAFANVQTNNDGTLVMSNWTRVGDGEIYYGETGEWTPPSGTNGGMVEFSGADRGNRSVILGDTDLMLGVESEVDLSQWNGRSLMFSAQYGAEYTVHARKTSCRWISGGKRCRTRSEHKPFDQAVMLTVTDTDSGSVLLETQLPYATQDRVERGIAAHQIDLATAAAGANRIKVRLWVRLPCAGRDVSSYAFRVRNIRLAGHKDELRCNLVRDPHQPTTQTEYDALGREIARVRPDGAATTTVYDRGARMVTNANGTVTTRYVDVHGRITAIDETLGDAAVTTRYVHRPATGELMQVTDASGGVYSFGYDALGRKILEHDDDRGEWRMSYDANGNLVRQLDANQDVTRTEFDALNRPARVEMQDSIYALYTYDVGDNAAGRLTSVVTPHMTRSYEYDPRGRAVAQLTTIDNRSWATGFRFDDADRITATTHPDGEVVRTTYDARGFVSQVTGDDNYVVGTSYSDQGKLTGLSYGNGTQLAYSYYDDGVVNPLSGSAGSHRLRTVSTRGGSVDLSLEYQYDRVGNVLALIDRADGGHSQHFSYDDADRLVSAGGLYGERSYDYDAVGNVLAFDGRTYEYGVGNRLTRDGRWRYTYDANGNVKTRTSDDDIQSYFYDSGNRLIRFAAGDTDERYSYDDGETRIRKVVGDTTTYYVSADYEEVWQNGERAEVVKHYRSGEQKVATRDGDGLKYIYPDHLGSSSRMADSRGAQVKAIWYMPFGGDANELGSAKARYRYTGQERDESGLYYYGARYYDAALGRFLAADSVLPDVYDPQVLNRFAYVRNNPMKLVDPDGHIPVPFVTGLIGAAVGAAVMTAGFVGTLAYVSVVTNSNAFANMPVAVQAEFATSVITSAEWGFVVGSGLGLLGMAGVVGVGVTGATGGGLGLSVSSLIDWAVAETEAHAEPDGQTGAGVAEATVSSVPAHGSVPPPPPVSRADPQFVRVAAEPKAQSTDDELDEPAKPAPSRPKPKKNKKTRKKS